MSDIGRYLDQAENYLQQGDLDQALGFYRLAVTEIERSPETRNIHESRIYGGIKSAKYRGLIRKANKETYSKLIEIKDRLFFMGLDLGNWTETARSTLELYDNRIRPWLAVGLHRVYEDYPEKIQGAIELLGNSNSIQAFNRTGGSLERGSVVGYLYTYLKLGSQIAQNVTKILNRYPLDCVENFMIVENELELKVLDDSDHERFLKMFDRLASEKTISIIECGNRKPLVISFPRLAFYIDDDDLFDRVLDFVGKLDEEKQIETPDTIYQIALDYGDEGVRNFLEFGTKPPNIYPTIEENAELFRPIENRRLELIEKDKKEGLTDSESEELAIIEFKCGNSSTAISLYKSRFGEDSMFPVDRLIEIGDSIISLGDHEMAEKAYKLALNQNPPENIRTEIKRKIQYITDRKKFGKKISDITKHEADKLRKNWKNLCEEIGIDDVLEPNKELDYTGLDDDLNGLFLD